MKCPACSHANPPASRFCENCGTALPRACPNCGQPVSPQARFCNNCGTALTASQAPPAPAHDRLALMQRSAPAALQERLRQASSEIEGERKPVTILFTDIVGSTRLAEQRDPEEWREIVSGAHHRVSEAVYRYEGIVAQLLGDGVLAFFGAPITHEDDPERAVRAGLDIQAAISNYAHELAGLVDDFALRVGIHTGTVVVGQVGDDLHMEYLAIGDAVNLAARLQSAAQPGQVLMSDATARLVRGAFELDDAGELELKGKSAPVRAFTARAARAPAVSLRAGGRQATLLVGRAVELSQLTQVLAGLRQGGGHIVAILGEAGLGKTRLVDEARQALAAGGPAVRWLEGRALSYGQALSFWTITQLLQADLDLADGDPSPRVRAALRRRCAELFGDQAGQVLPYLAHLLGVRLDGAEAERAAALEGETLKRQVLRSLRRYFEQAAQAQPLVLVCEDLHWADPSSLEALEHLLALTDRVPLALILLARPERDTGAWRLRVRAESDYPHRFTEISLKPLSPAEQSQLVNHLVSADIPAETRQLILARAEGNPFYLEEVVHSLQEQGALVEVNGHWQASATLQTITIPETLQGVLLARLDRLADDVHRTLQLAAVIGKNFSYRLLEAISEAERQLDTHLAQLQRVDLVREKTRQPELEYMFKHALTQEAAYQSLLLERRREFHHRVAEALEGLFTDRPEEAYGLLAYHYEAAGDTAKATAYLLRAGDQARLGDALPEARDYYQRAVTLQEAAGDAARAARTWLKLGLVHQAEFRFEQAHQAYEAAFALKQQAPAAQPSAPTPPSEKPRRLVVGADTTWLGALHLDPGQAVHTADFEALDALFAGLAEMDREANIVPHAARSWEVLDEGRRYLFHLRADVRWSDDAPVTAHDFEFAWKRNLQPGRPEYPASLLDDVLGAREYRRGLNPDPGSVGVRALNDLTLEVLLAEPVAYFVYLVAQPVAFPQPRHVIERVGDDWWQPPQAVSNGAFRLVAHDPRHATLARQRGYFGENPGNLDQLEILYLVKSAEAIQRYLAGEVDFAIGLGGQVKFPESIPAAERQPASMLNCISFWLNPGLPPTDDIRVRRALAHGLDVQRMLHAGFGPDIQRAQGGLLPPGMAGHSPELGLPFDLARARELLAAAGYPGGRGLPPLRFRDFPDAPTSAALQRQLREDLGVQIEFTEEQAEAIASNHMLAQGWVTDYPDPDGFMRLAPNWDYLSQPDWLRRDYTQLVDEAARTADRRQRLALYRQADRLLVNDTVIVIPTRHRTSWTDLVAPGVTGYERGLLGTLIYKNLRLDPDEAE